MILKFNQFINESLRDKMVGKTKDEIKTDVLSSDLDPNDLLEGAIKEGMLDIMIGIIEKYSIDVYWDKGHNILNLAAFYNKTDIVEYFLDRGVDPNGDGGRLIRYPIDRNNVEMLKMFLDNGYTLNTKSGYCEALEIARRDRKSPEIIKTLLDYGANDRS